MKKGTSLLQLKFGTTLLLALLLAIGSGCQKTAPVNLNETNAHIIDGGDPAADGMGLYIRLDDTRETVIPINLPVEYQQKGIDEAVAIKLISTGKTTFRGEMSPGAAPLRVVYLVSIRKR